MHGVNLFEQQAKLQQNLRSLTSNVAHLDSSALEVDGGYYRICRDTERTSPAVRGENERQHPGKKRICSCHHAEADRRMGAGAWRTGSDMSNRIYSKVRRNPNWLIRLARWVGMQRRKINLYFFYRRLGHQHDAALDKVERTL